MKISRIMELAGLKVPLKYFGIPDILTEGTLAVPATIGQQPGGLTGEEEQMQTRGTVGRNAAYVAFDAAQQPATESAPPGEEKLVRSIKKEYPGHEEKAFATAWSIYNKKQGKKEECTMGMEEDISATPGVVSCNQDNPADCRTACAMEESANEYDMNFIRQAITQMYDMATSEDELRRMVASETGYGDNPDFHHMFDIALDHFQNGDDSSFDHMDDSDEFTDYTMRQGEMGNPDRAMEEAFDLQNGYDDEYEANGNDYFPNGADSPVVRTAGPSGARQGDNPEQKKMQVAEVHKELVYGYRNFLKESEMSKKAKAKKEDNEDKPFDIDAWKKSGKKNNAPAGFGKNGFATKLMKDDKKSGKK